MRPASEMTQYLFKDIKDQPQSTHVLLLTLTDTVQGVPMSYRRLFAVDAIDTEANQGQMTALRYDKRSNDFKNVVSFTPDHSFVLVHRDYLELHSVEEAQEHMARDYKEQQRSIEHYRKIMEREDDTDIIQRYGSVPPVPYEDKDLENTPAPEPKAKPFDLDSWFNNQFPNSPEEGPSSGV